jgi:hypothetical protein
MIVCVHDRQIAVNSSSTSICLHFTKPPILFKAPTLTLNDDLAARQRLGLVVGGVLGNRNLKVLSIEGNDSNPVLRVDSTLLLRVDFRLAPVTVELIDKLNRLSVAQGLPVAQDYDLGTGDDEHTAGVIIGGEAISTRREPFLPGTIPEQLAATEKIGGYPSSQGRSLKSWRDVLWSTHRLKWGLGTRSLSSLGRTLKLWSHLSNRQCWL